MIVEKTGFSQKRFNLQPQLDIVADKMYLVMETNYTKT